MGGVSPASTQPRRANWTASYVHVRVPCAGQTLVGRARRRSSISREGLQRSQSWFTTTGLPYLATTCGRRTGLIRTKLTQHPIRRSERERPCVDRQGGTGARSTGREIFAYYLYTPPPPGLRKSGLGRESATPRSHDRGDGRRPDECPVGMAFSELALRARALHSALTRR